MKTFSRAAELYALRDPRYPVHKIADQLEPYILFGSQAYGDPNEHSDVDLLIIRRGIKSERQSNIEIRSAFDILPGRHNFSFTILSKTPERIAERLAIKSPFYEDIIGKGVELYARRADG